MTSNTEVLVSICITSDRNMEVEKKCFNDVFFLHSLFPLTVVKECSMNSEILSSSAAHIVNGSES